MLRKLLDSPWPYFVGAALLLVLAIASQLQIAGPSRPKGGRRGNRGAARTQGSERHLPAGRYPARRSPGRVRLYASHQPRDRRSRPHRDRVPPRLLAIELDEDLDGLALDGHLSRSQWHAALRPCAARGGVAAGRDLPECGLPHRGHLAQRLGRPELRVSSGLRVLSQPEAGPQPRAAAAQPPLARVAHRHGRGRRGLLARVPRQLRARALLPLSALHGPAPVRLRRLRPRFRQRLFRRLRQVDPLDRSPDRGAGRRSSGSEACSTAR